MGKILLDSGSRFSEKLCPQPVLAKFHPLSDDVTLAWQTDFPAGSQGDVGLLPIEIKYYQNVFIHFTHTFKKIFSCLHMEKVFSLCMKLLRCINGVKTACISVCHFWNSSPVHRLIKGSSFRAESGSVEQAGSVAYSQPFQVPGAQQGVGSLLLIPLSCQLLLKHTHIGRG